MLRYLSIHPLWFTDFNNITMLGLNKIKEYAKDIWELKIERNKIYFTPKGFTTTMGCYDFDFSDYGTNNKVTCVSDDQCVVVYAIQMWLEMRGYIVVTKHYDTCPIPPELKDIYVSAQGILMENHLL